VSWGKMAVTLRDILGEMLSHPVAFHPILARIAGGASAGLFLSQAVYWSKRATLPDGWFYKIREEWEEETCLTRSEQETARRDLREVGVLEERKWGTPCKLYYRVNHTRLAELVKQHTEKQQAEKPQSSLPESSKQESSKQEPRQQDGKSQQAMFAGKSPAKDAGKQPTKRTETTQRLPETTAESGAAASATPAITMPCVDGSEFPITKDQIAEWQQAYPAVDVLQQLREMRVWCTANPKNRKTPTGVLRFVITWLAREQDKAPVRPEYSAEPPKKPKIQTKRVWDGAPSDDQLKPDGGLWESIKAKLSETVNRHSYDTWLKPTRTHGLAGRVLYIRVPTPEFRNIGEKFSKEILALLPAGIDDVCMCDPKEVPCE
jgi:hypothetical protein